MGLVDYSDSESSDIESASAPVSAKTTTKKEGSAFPKPVNRLEPGKIRVTLPSSQPEVHEQDEQRPTKKAKTTGAFSGFNSLLPAPKKAAHSGPKAGVSLRTSSEAAFNREPPSTLDVNGGSGEDLTGDLETGSRYTRATELDSVAESKVVGKATKFKPLSVSNKKKPVKKTKLPDGAKKSLSSNAAEEDALQKTGKSVLEAAPPPKPKRSLFSVPQEDNVHEPITSETYESLMERPRGLDLAADGDITAQQPVGIAQAPSHSNSLHSLASDLNLTPAQRRQLFGRHAKDADVSIAHFHMDNEYAANEQLRQAGEVVEHRAVKAIAPGKHSLQQLVNNARSQQDAMEDKWAEGRRERGEGGAKYGFGK